MIQQSFISSLQDDKKCYQDGTPWKLYCLPFLHPSSTLAHTSFSGPLPTSTTHSLRSSGVPTSTCSTSHDWVWYIISSGKVGKWCLCLPHDTPPCRSLLHWHFHCVYTAFWTQWRSCPVSAIQILKQCHRTSNWSKDYVQKLDKQTWPIWAPPSVTA